MDDREARSILSLHRTGETEAAAALFLEAQKRAEADGELARWWTEEQELDRLIASKLQQAHVPSRPPFSLPFSEQPVTVLASSWRRAALLTAAAVIVLAIVFGSWRGPFQSATSLAEYRDEMVSFIKIDPALELESGELARVTDFLEKAGAPGPLEIPKPLRNLEALGCRTLRFRGQDVALICFRRAEGSLVHMFVIKRSALPQSADWERPQYAAEHDWMTATWLKGDYAYLVTTEGSREELEKFITDG